VAEPNQTARNVRRSGVLLYAGLVSAWVTVAARTLRGVRDGGLLRPA